MKRYSQFSKQFPPNSIVVTFGDFQIPNVSHGKLLNQLNKICEFKSADNKIFVCENEVSNKEPLLCEKKIYFLQRAFRENSFESYEDTQTAITEKVKQLSEQYSSITILTQESKAEKLQESLKKAGLSSVEIITYGNLDPDSESKFGVSNAKIRESAKSGDFAAFRKGVTPMLTELDSKRLMNDIREGMGLEPIKEVLKFQTNSLREDYISGKVFNVGDMVSENNRIFEIVSRGPNYVTVVDGSGNTMKKWLDSLKLVNIKEDVQPGYAPSQITYKGYTTKNFDHSEDAVKAFRSTILRDGDPVAILNALKATDFYMGMNDRHIQGEKFTDEERDAWINAHEKARDYLNKLGEFAHHQDYWHMHQHELEDALIPYTKSAEKKEAVDESTNPKTPMNSKYESFVKNILKKTSDPMPKISNEAMGIGVFDTSTALVKQGTTIVPDLAPERDQLRKKKIRYHLGEETDSDDKEVNSVISLLSDDDLFDAYEDDELHIIDDNTGELVSKLKEDVDTNSEEMIVEVLSRAERIRTKIRFAKSEAKRERRLVIALHTRSTPKKLSMRARRIAIKLLKKRIAKKPLNSLSVPERERIEKIVEMNKALVDRIAMKLAPKVRKLENDRLVHRKYTKDSINELSTEKLRQYKTSAAADARAADKSGDTARGNKRFKGIIKATLKQFSNETKPK